MADQFKNHKKRLYHDYILKKKTSQFTRANEKLKDQWDEFVLFKNSDVAKKRSEINKGNAKKKIYHHVMGPGDYKSNRPKWEKAEKELIDKGINPEKSEWTERAK
jgi:tRNA 2-selenouridine synthase SelU